MVPTDLFDVQPRSDHRDRPSLPDREHTRLGHDHLLNLRADCLEQRCNRIFKIMPNGVDWYCNSEAMVPGSDPVVPMNSLEIGSPPALCQELPLTTNYRGQRSAPGW